MYMAIDGDDVGAEIERLVVLCQPEALTFYWKSVSSVITKLGKQLTCQGANVLICGGDTILAELDKAPSFKLIYELFSNTLPLSFSIGTGQTMLEAYIALKTAKVSGKNCWVDYSDLSSIRRLQCDIRGGTG
jgi:GTP cyclohydrolase III